MLPNRTGWGAGRARLPTARAALGGRGTRRPLPAPWVAGGGLPSSPGARGPISEADAQSAPVPSSLPLSRCPEEPASAAQGSVWGVIQPKPAGLLGPLPVSLSGELGAGGSGGRFAPRLPVSSAPIRPKVSIRVLAPRREKEGVSSTGGGVGRQATLHPAQTPSLAEPRQRPASCPASVSPLHTGDTATTARCPALPECRASRGPARERDPP